MIDKCDFCGQQKRVVETIVTVAGRTAKICHSCAVHRGMSAAANRIDAEAEMGHFFEQLSSAEISDQYKKDIGDFVAKIKRSGYGRQ